VAAPAKQAPDGAARFAELQYLLRYGAMKEACPLSCAQEIAGMQARMLSYPAPADLGGLVEEFWRTLESTSTGRGWPRWRRDEETGRYMQVAGRWHVNFCDRSRGQGMPGPGPGPHRR
jgi:hypothetical protein